MRRRSRPKRLRATLLSLLGGVVLLGVIFVGPWPTYDEVDLEQTDDFRQAFDAIGESAAQSQTTAQPGRLRAGWASRLLRPPAGTPMAGYGDREGQPATGTHDPLHAKALVLSDGNDTVAIVSADLLIVPENVAEAVRARVAEQVPLSAADILFNASHTHSGPGAFAPGWVAEQFSGLYDPAMVALLVEVMTKTIVAAYRDLAPARLGQGKIGVPGHITNRARASGAVDPDLHFMVVEQDSAEPARRCTLVSYAAHATLLDADNMHWSADYTGYLTQTLQHKTGGMAMFLAGAMGSMGPVAPAGLEGFAAAETLGRSLAQKVVSEMSALTLDDRLDITSAGVALQMPPFQVRWNRWLRLSPFLVRGLGLNNQAWLQGIRIGDTVLIGTPSDFSGELSIELKSWAANLGHDLWVLSFNGDYIGYVSPDHYYETASRDGREGYEMYVMSWCGPQQGEFLVRLIERMVMELSG